MSLDSGDINNDLKLDIFATDMLFRREMRSNQCGVIQDPTIRRRCKSLVGFAESFLERDLSVCKDLKTVRKRMDCFVTVTISMAHFRKEGALCNLIPKEMEGHRALCGAVSKRTSIKSKRSRGGSDLDQVFKNVLLVQASQGKFEDRSAVMDVEASSWSWAGKFLDINNDGWLDIYVGTGHMGLIGRGTDVYPNYLFENQEGKRFLAKQNQYGLDDPILTSSFTVFDVDRDGDLDLFMNAVNGPYRFYENREFSHHSITIALRDNVGNRFCIGCSVIIRFGKQQHQIREIKAGGGFLAFDAPEIHFGLGKVTEIDSLTVRWSTGEKTTFKKRLAANRHYLIERRGKASLRHREPKG